jgi:hypothetical protein
MLGTTYGVSSLADDLVLAKTPDRHNFLFQQVDARVYMGAATFVFELNWLKAFFVKSTHYW